MIRSLLANGRLLPCLAEPMSSVGEGKARYNRVKDPARSSIAPQNYVICKIHSRIISTNDMEAFINDIKHRDAKELCFYLDTLTYHQSVEFVNEVVRLTGVNRRTFFNWKYMCCRIPEWAKTAMEKVAGQSIFLDELPINIVT